MTRQLAGLDTGFGNLAARRLYCAFISAAAPRLRLSADSQFSAVAVGLSVSIHAAVAVCILTLPACRTAHDTSRLSPEGLRQYKSLQIVNVVNDVSQSAILANSTGALSQEATAAILTIDKQVLDFLETNPQGALASAAVIARNARDALPADVRVTVEGYIAKVIAVLEAQCSRWHKISPPCNLTNKSSASVETQPHEPQG